MDFGAKLHGLKKGSNPVAYTFVDNWFCVKEGQPAFRVLSNWCDYFSLGAEAGDDVWLEGKIVGNGEFVFNGRFFMDDGSGGTVIDNFPKAEAPSGWTQRRKLDEDGYELLDPRGELVFGYSVQDKVCTVELNLHKKDGQLAAHGGQGGMVLHVPARLGSKGVVIGGSGTAGAKALPGLPGGPRLK